VFYLFRFAGLGKSIKLFTFEKIMADLLKYPPKILIAFGEAISRNVKIHEWLFKNGYPELGALASSLQADEKGFDWLMKNGYPQFAAFCNAIDEDKIAYDWLINNKFNLLIILHDAAYERLEAIKWLKDKNLEIFIVIAAKIRELKANQHRDYEDYHKIHFK